MSLRQQEEQINERQKYLLDIIGSKGRRRIDVSWSHYDTTILEAVSQEATESCLRLSMRHGRTAVSWTAGTSISSLIYGMRHLRNSVSIRRSMQTASVNMTRLRRGSIWICCLTAASLSERISRLTKKKQPQTAVKSAQAVV